MTKVITPKKSEEVWMDGFAVLVLPVLSTGTSTGYSTVLVQVQAQALPVASRVPS